MSDPRFVSPRLPAEFRRPAVIGWNRLEGRPRTPEFERSLRAEVADPLWMLSRQWQLGEFHGEDAGSPILAQAVYEVATLESYHVGDRFVRKYDGGTPLERVVEQERPPLDLGLRVAIGQKWLRLVAKAVGDQRYRALYVAALAFEERGAGAQAPEYAADAAARRWYALATTRAVDGARLLAILQGGGSLAAVVGPDGERVAGDDNVVIVEAQRALTRWLQRTHPDIPRDPPAWRPERLEHGFGCVARGPSGDKTSLVAEEFAAGHLDWYSFDELPKADWPAPPSRPGGGAGSDLGSDRARHMLTFLPTPAEFPGMPKSRWWELEDRGIDFGSVDADTTDLVKLLFLEYALVFSNDWGIVPIDVPVGSVTRVEALVVTDVFGQRTLVRPAGSGRGESWQHWSMFSIDSVIRGATGRGGLFVPPAVAIGMEGSPVEAVVMGRDEMLNTVWAVENVVPSALGAGRDGAEFVRDLAAGRAVDAPAQDEPPAAADIRYRLMGEVPANWIPFVPTRIPGTQRQVQLQRAHLAGAPDDNSERGPYGRLLAPDGVAPYRIHEEEIDRAGVQVARAYQRVRWHDGSVHVWLGRRKTAARGPVSSGLRFDSMEEVSAGEDGEP